MHVMKACAGGGGGGQIYSSALSLTSALQGRKILDIHSTGRLGGLQSRLEVPERKTPCLRRHELRIDQPVT